MRARQVGETGAVGRIGRAAGLDHQVEVHQRKVVELDQDDLEPVLQLEPLPGWRMEGGFGPAPGRSCRNGASGVCARATGAAAGARGQAATVGETRRPAPDGRLGRAGRGAGAAAGERRRRERIERRRQASAAARARRLTSSPRPMMGASGLGSTVIITRAVLAKHLLGDALDGRGLDARGSAGHPRPGIRGHRADSCSAGGARRGPAAPRGFAPSPTRSGSWRDPTRRSSTGRAWTAAISSSMTARISSRVWPGMGEAVISKSLASSWLS